MKCLGKMGYSKVVISNATHLVTTAYPISLKKSIFQHNWREMGLIKIQGAYLNIVILRQIWIGF